jgi:hypothetical protein
MAAGTGRRHAMLLFTVLAGLFLMHGLSAPSMHGMPMSMHLSTQMSPPMSSHADSAMPSHVDAPDAVSGAMPTTDHMQAGETCIPLRPEGLSGLFLALFLIVIALWRPRPPNIPRPIHPHWPHGPPRAGVQILRTLSVSRT